MTRIKSAFCSVVLLLIAACGGSNDAPQAAIVPPALPHYEYIPNSGPLIVLMAASAEESIHGMGRLPADLTSAGFSLLALDLPCHGQDAEPNLDGLVCWRRRMEAGDKGIFREFCKGVTAVLDHFSVKRAGVVGLSRGAYVAATCAETDARLQYLGLLAPVTDLEQLSEFNGYAVDDPNFQLLHYRAQLSKRHVLVRIARDDERVGTESAVNFAQTIGADLQVLDLVGHVAPEDGATTQWMIGMF
jgi:alpha-beta hydrolase superfamily lysophospholipase